MVAGRHGFGATCGPLSIMFELYRMTPHGYRLALEGKYYDDEDLAYEGNVGKQWDILRRMLATGSYPTLRWPQAICGGNALRPEDDYDGVRVLSPDQLAESAVSTRSSVSTPSTPPRRLCSGRQPLLVI